MKVDPARCALVIVGSWNVAIFTPPFVGKHVFPGPETIQPEMVFGPGGPVPYYGGPHFELSVQPSRVMWQPRSFQDDALTHLEEAALRLLRVLSVTPIGAIGVNFGFDVAEPTDLLAKTLSTLDSEKIEATAGRIVSTLVKRSIGLEGAVLNFAIAREQDAVVRLDFNFHRDVRDAPDALRRLSGSILRFKKEALRLLGEWYGLQLEGI